MARASVGARDARLGQLSRLVREHLASAAGSELATGTRAIRLARGRGLVRDMSVRSASARTRGLLAKHLRVAAFGELDVVGLLGRVSRRLVAGAECGCSTV